MFDESLPAVSHAMTIRCVFISGLSDYTTASDCRNLSNWDERSARRLLVVAPSPPSVETYGPFSDNVTTYSARPPFNFKASIFGLAWKKHVSVYAANLYDSLLLYATALHRLRLLHPDTHVQTLARDGRAIFNAIIRMKSYLSESLSERRED
jgi:hypothetical protein